MIKFYKLLEEQLNKNSDKKVKFETLKLPEIDTKNNQPIQAELNSHQAMYENIHGKPSGGQFCNKYKKLKPMSQGVKSRKPIEDDFEITM